MVQAVTSGLRNIYMKIFTKEGFVDFSFVRVNVKLGLKEVNFQHFIFFLLKCHNPLKEVIPDLIDVCVARNYVRTTKNIQDLKRKKNLWKCHTNFLPMSKHQLPLIKLQRFSIPAKKKRKRKSFKNTRAGILSNFMGL